MEQLEQARFYHYFKEISAIPRGSGDEKRISDYVVRFAGSHGLHCAQDELWNVVVRKDAAPGYEGAEPVILQCHMDMVCEKLPESAHDFSADPIRLLEADGYLTADGTTLGSDNGMGMAYILAVLEDKSLPHPSIEAIFTTNEEVGMEGMAGLDTGVLKATRMLNLDAEEEGVFITSCAGGVRIHLDLPTVREPVPRETGTYRLEVDGLVGGHSGLDIGKGRANAIQLLARCLESLTRRYTVWLQAVRGGAKTNSIPRAAQAVLRLREDEAQLVSQELERLQRDFRKEFAGCDPGITLSLSAHAETLPSCLDPGTVRRLLSAVLLMPCGVLSYSPHILDMVDSSCSLGVLEMGEECIHLVSMARANVNSKMDDVVSRVQLLSDCLGGVFYTRNRYSAWEYNAGSALRPLCEEAYRSLFGCEPECTSIHAGLECSMMAGCRPEMDMISMGPNLLDAHTPSERVEIASTLRIWQYLQHLLESMRP